MISWNSSLTKFNGINIEHIIDRHPDVKACLVAGEGKVKPFVLVQPGSFLEALHLSSDEVIERIWPAIEAANKTLIEQAELGKKVVLITREDAPTARLAKGTINRRATLKVYEGEIEELYWKCRLDYDASHGGENAGVVNDKAEGKCEWECEREGEWQDGIDEAEAQWRQRRSRWIVLPGR